VPRLLCSLSLLLVLYAVGGCINVSLLGEGNSLFVTGESFILTGTATIQDNNGPQLVWIGENGFTYHLFQATQLDNDAFDRVTTPGTTSRLQLATRTDLQVVGQVGTVVEVQRVLEIDEP
jgi:hypothetical protein